MWRPRFAVREHPGIAQPTMHRVSVGADQIGLATEGPHADDGVLRVVVHIAYWREVEIDTHRSQPSPVGRERPLRRRRFRRPTRSDAMILSIFWFQDDFRPEAKML